LEGEKSTLRDEQMKSNELGLMVALKARPTVLELERKKNGMLEIGRGLTRGVFISSQAPGRE